MKLFCDPHLERPAREMLQQFEPEGAMDGKEDGFTLSAVQRGKNLWIEIGKTDQPGCILEYGLDLNEAHSYLTVDEQIKRAFYDVLADWHRKHLKWGMLTGVKPVRFYKKIHEHFPDTDTKTLLTDEFRLSPQKAELIEEIYLRQKPYLDQVKRRRSLSIYVGIPICPARCSYCSFVSTLIDPKRQILIDYFPKLLSEIDQTAELFNREGYEVDSLYIGGGTPSLLSAVECDQLFDHLRSRFNLSQLNELTFEAGRPDITTPELLESLEKNGVDRICLNPQSMQQETLDKVNRLYPVQRVYDVYEMIKNHPSFLLNMDLIIGLEGEDEEAFLDSLDKVIALDPENITIHELSIKKGTRMKDRFGTGDNSHFSDAFFEEVQRRLREAGYVPYYIYRQKYTIGNGENIGYCKPGKESFYNIIMMAEEQTILGLGAGSSGKLYNPDKDQFSRVYSVKDLRTYNQRSDELIEKKLSAYRTYLGENFE